MQPPIVVGTDSALFIFNADPEERFRDLLKKSTGMRTFLSAYQHLGVPKDILILCEEPLDVGREMTVSQRLRKILSSGRQSGIKIISQRFCGQHHNHNNHNNHNKYHYNQEDDSTHEKTFLKDIFFKDQFVQTTNENISTTEKDNKQTSIVYNTTQNQCENFVNKEEEENIEEKIKKQLEEEEEEENEKKEMMNENNEFSTKEFCFDNTKPFPWADNSFDLILGRGVICCCGITATGGPCGVPSNLHLFLVEVARILKRQAPRRPYQALLHGDSIGGNLEMWNEAAQGLPSDVRVTPLIHNQKMRGLRIEKLSH